MKTGKKYSKIDEYITDFPVEVQLKLSEMRAIIQKAAPDAEEKIGYNMPAFTQNGILVYFAAFKDHIGFFPTSTPIQIFKEDLKEFRWSKGAIRFPLDKPLPSDLISRIVTFKVRENMEKAKARLLLKKV